MRGALFATATSIAWCVGAVWILYFFPSFCDSINLRLFDWKLSIAHPPDVHRRIVHLDIDDEAVTHLGSWPWDRAVSAQIVRRLTALGARLIVFDVLYTVPRTAQGDQELFEAVRDSERSVLSAAMGLSGSDDEKLVVEGDTSRADLIYDNAWNLRVPSALKIPKVVGLKNAFLPMLPLIQNAKGLGHMTGTPDADGVYRRIPLLVRLEDHYVPALSLATLSAYLGFNEDSIIVSRKGCIELLLPDRPVRIPLDSRGMMIIHWSPIWDSFPHYSVTDILNDKPDTSRAGRYRDKIVIIGVVATGATDFGVSPVSVHTPLSRIHSNALNTILMNNFITPVKPVPYLVACSVVLTVLFALISGWLRLRNTILLALAMVVLTVSASIALFSMFAYEIPITELLLVFVPGSLAAIIVRITTLELRASRTSRALERYLSPELLEQIVEQDVELDLSTKRTELTIMFVDVEGFSTISETVDAEYINRLLNGFFEAMTQAIFQNKGTVDKFLGDGVLAFFGNPVPLANHAQAALRAAIAMQRSMAKLNAEWSQWGISELERGIRIRIGLNTGMVIVGNIGSDRRLEYTVLGSAVNIASRLQSLAPSGGIIMAARTHSLAKENIEYQGPDHVKVKGIDKAIEVFRIHPEAIARYSQEGAQ